jgi:hypothetical protein
MNLSSYLRPGIVAAAAAAFLLAGAPGVPASTAAVTTGQYVGKTSQGQPIRFKIVTGKCDSPRPPYKFHQAVCFQGQVYDRKLDAFYPKVLEPCSDGTTYSDPLYAASYKLSLTSSGSLSWTVRGLGSTLTSGGSLTTIKLQVKHGKATGTLRQTESYDTGAGAVSCDSKTITFTAHRTG